MSIEKEKPPAQRTIVLVEHQDGEKITYRPVLINDNSRNKIGNFLNEEREVLKKRLLELQTIPPKGHSRDRGARETRDIRVSREKVISQEQIETKLAILNGEILAPIKVIQSKGKFKECQLATYTDEDQERFWTFIQQNLQMDRMLEIAQKYEEGIEGLVLFYNARYRHKYASVQDLELAEALLEEAKTIASSVPEDYDTLFVPIYSLITKKLAS